MQYTLSELYHYNCSIFHSIQVYWFNVEIAIDY